MVQSSFDLIFSRFQMAISALQFALKVDLKANVQALDVPGMYRHQVCTSFISIEPPFGFRCPHA